VLCFFFFHDSRLGSMLCLRFVPRGMDVPQISFDKRLGCVEVLDSEDEETGARA